METTEGSENKAPNSERPHKQPLVVGAVAGGRSRCIRRTLRRKVRAEGNHPRGRESNEGFSTEKKSAARTQVR